VVAVRLKGVLVEERSEAVEGSSPSLLSRASHDDARTSEVGDAPASPPLFDSAPQRGDPSLLGLQLLPRSDASAMAASNDGSGVVAGSSSISLDVLVVVQAIGDA